MSSTGLISHTDGLIQLAGLHSNAYINDKFAKAFAQDGMKAYVELIQRKERAIGCDVLTHQKVSLSFELQQMSGLTRLISGQARTMPIQ